MRFRTPFVFHRGHGFIPHMAYVYGIQQLQASEWEVVEFMLMHKFLKNKSKYLPCWGSVGGAGTAHGSKVTPETIPTLPRTSVCVCTHQMSQLKALEGISRFTSEFHWPDGKA